MKIAAIASNLAVGHVHVVTSANCVVIVTCRDLASACALARAVGEKSTERTSRPCSASHTPLRPSPSATASARPRAGSRWTCDRRKALGLVPKTYSGTENLVSQRSYSLMARQHEYARLSPSRQRHLQDIGTRVNGGASEVSGPVEHFREKVWPAEARPLTSKCG